MKKFKVMAVILCALIVLLSVSACSTKAESSQNKLNIDEIRVYADDIAEKILQAGNNLKYEDFSESFSDTMKAALDKATFEKLIEGFDKRIGKYQSKEFQKIETDKQYIAVIYKAQYSEESNGVTVRVVFENIEGKNIVSGLFFDSPNLRKQ